jgi:hypothetical protein
MLRYKFSASLVLRNISLPLRTTLSDSAHLAERNCLIHPLRNGGINVSKTEKTYFETKLNNSSFETAGNSNPATQHQIAQDLDPQGKQERRIKMWSGRTKTIQF